MSRDQEVAVGDLHAGDLGRIVRIVDERDNRLQVTGKLIGVDHVVIGRDLHTTVTIAYSSRSGSISMMLSSEDKLLFGPPITDRAELLT